MLSPCHRPRRSARWRPSDALVLEGRLVVQQALELREDRFAERLVFLGNLLVHLVELGARARLAAGVLLNGGLERAQLLLQALALGDVVLAVVVHLLLLLQQLARLRLQRLDLQLERAPPLVQLGDLVARLAAQQLAVLVLLLHLRTRRRYAGGPAEHVRQAIDGRGAGEGGGSPRRTSRSFSVASASSLL